MSKEQRRTTAVVFAAAGLAAMILAAPAQANPVRFDNPAGTGHFDWNATAGHEYLTILAGPESQPGTPLVAGTFWRRDPATNDTTVRGRNGMVQYYRLDNPTQANMLVGVDLGVTIPTPVGPNMGGLGSNGFVFRTSMESGWPNTLLPEGTQTYLGVSFDPGTGVQYGWIGVVRTGTQLDAFAWGYETTAGVPIPAGAPEPGTLALLAFGAVAAMRRKQA
jgi:hypothetical protein